MTTTHLGDLADQLTRALNAGESTGRIVLAIADALPAAYGEYELIDSEPGYDLLVEAMT